MQVCVALIFVALTGFDHPSSTLDWLRVVAMGMAITSIAYLLVMMYEDWRGSEYPRRVQLLLAALALLLANQVYHIQDRYGEAFTPFATPTALAATVLIFIYVVIRYANTEHE